MSPNVSQSTQEIAVVSGRLSVPPSYFLLTVPRLLRATYNFSFHGLRLSVDRADFEGFRLQEEERLTPVGLYRTLMRSQPTLVHQHWATWSSASVEAARQLRIPLVVSVHGYDAFLPPSRGPAGPAMDVAKRVERRRALRAAAQVVVNSAFMADRLQNIGVPYSRISIIRHGVDTTYLAPDGRQRAGLLFVGRLSEEKGASLLLTAVSLLRGRVDIPVTIVGDGPELGRLRAQAHSLGIPVRFAGRLRHSDVREELRNAKLVVVPSINTRFQAEASGIAPLEAMACGTPVIVTRVGGLPENLPTDLDELIADPSPLALADAISAALETDWTALSHAVRAHAVASHSDDIVAASFERLYGRALHHG